jgi:hypothetical protein
MAIVAGTSIARWWYKRKLGAFVIRLGIRNSRLRESSGAGGGARIRVNGYFLSDIVCGCHWVKGKWRFFCLSTYILSGYLTAARMGAPLARKRSFRAARFGSR